MKPHALVAVALMFGACHTKQVARDERAQVMQAPPPQREVQSARPVRTTPNAMIPPEKMRQLQAALSRHGANVAKSGHLDRATEAALRKFQRAQSVPETGLPDFETVQRLGLDPQKIYLTGEK